MATVVWDPGMFVDAFSARTEKDNAVAWSRVIEWSSDRRIRLGARGYEKVLGELNRRGWDVFGPDRCPPPLSREARRAVTSLTQTPPAMESVDSGCEFDPAYVFDASIAPLLASDVVSYASSDHVGIATAVENWEEPSESVSLAPCLNTPVPLLFGPAQTMISERDELLRLRLRGQRINIAGALRNQNVERRLREVFSDIEIRWIESQPKKPPDIDRLRSMVGDRDILVCIKGADGQLGLGHSGSQKAIDYAKAGGVRFAIVDISSQVPDGVAELLEGPSDV